MLGYDFNLIIFDSKGNRISTLSSRTLRMCDVVEAVAKDLNNIMVSYDVRTVSLIISKVDGNASNSS